MLAMNTASSEMNIIELVLRKAVQGYQDFDTEPPAILALGKHHPFPALMIL